ncbi:MAG: recombinase family protein [Clostridia bacterium]
MEAWDASNIGFLSVQRGFDTTTALGRLLVNLLASRAEFELELTGERVVAGMARAKAQGKDIAWSRGLDHPTLRQVWDQLAPCIAAGCLSRGEATQLLGCGDATVRRLLAAQDERRNRYERDLLHSPLAGLLSLGPEVHSSPPREGSRPWTQNSKATWMLSAAMWRSKSPPPTRRWTC